MCLTGFVHGKIRNAGAEEDVELHTTIILASKSPRRTELLSQIGIRHICLVSGTEEVITRQEPDQVVIELAQGKALAVAEGYQDFHQDQTVFIGADTVVSRNGKILGKPDNETEAVQMLQSLQGDSHCVYTGVCLLLYHGRTLEHKITFSECTKVWMYPMTQAETERYVSTGEPMDKAGSYGIQGIGASYIQKIEGDYNNVVGLPVGRIYQELKKYGYIDYSTGQED